MRHIASAKSMRSRTGILARAVGSTFACSLVALATAPVALGQGAVSISGSTLVYSADDSNNDPDIHQDTSNSGGPNDEWEIEDRSGSFELPIIPSSPCVNGDRDDLTPEYPEDYREAFCPKVVSELDITLRAGNDRYSQLDGPHPNTPPLVQDLFLTVRAGPGNDEINAGDSGSVILGEEGNDDIYGTELVDALDGGTGSDLFLADDGADALVGGPDADTLHAGSGRGDQVQGDEGDDLITDFHGNGSIDAGEGNDKVKAVSGSGPGDEIDCGPGRDKAVVDKKKDKTRGCEKVKRK